MAWVAVDEDGEEVVFKEKPIRVKCGEFVKCGGIWVYDGSIEDSAYVEFPKGSIKKLIGRELTWIDEPVELKEEKE